MPYKLISDLWSFIENHAGEATPEATEEFFALRERVRQSHEETPLVRIEIRGGCLAEVTGLLPGQEYELIDHDNLEEENNGADS